MQVLRLAIAIGLASIAAYFIYNIYRLYRDATGTVWQRFLAAGRESATMLWSKFIIILAGIVANLDYMADLIGQPGMKEYIDQLAGNPRTVAIVMLVISVVTMTARARTL